MASSHPEHQAAMSGRNLSGLKSAHDAKVAQMKDDADMDNDHDPGNDNDKDATGMPGYAK